MSSLCTIVELQNISYCSLTIVSIKYYECVSVLLPSLSSVRIGSFLRLILLSSVLRLAVPYFSTLSNKRNNFRHTIVAHKMWGLFFKFFQQLLSEIFLILRRIWQHVISLHRFRVKYPLFLSDFNEIWIFSTDFRRIFRYQISWKSFQWEPTYSMRTDGQTHDEANSRFSQFCERA
jgi:hypothetical protein